MESRSVGKLLPSNSDCKKIFSFTWDAFFDGREMRFVDVLEINLDELRTWVGVSVSRRTEVLYVTFTGTPPLGMDAKGDGYMYVVRLTNGSRLPNALTVATDRPFYVQGDYNTNTWVPAALGGDAITWLSNAWNDSQHQCGSPYRPDLLTQTAKCPGYTIYNPSNTTLNAAVVAGHIPTPCDHEDAGCPGGNYGGGLENFPRHLEKWTGFTMTYLGSLISLHYSRIAMGPGFTGRSTSRRTATGRSIRGSGIRRTCLRPRRWWDRLSIRRSARCTDEPLRRRHSRGRRPADHGAADPKHAGSSQAFLGEQNASIDADRGIWHRSLGHV